MKAIKTNIETVDKESMKDNGMEVEAEEDTWDSMFNEEGDCLDPSAMEEVKILYHHHLWSFFHQLDICSLL